MYVKLNWHSHIHFTATNSEGHQIPIDGAPASGGQNAGTRPMEMILSALAACMAMDVVLILKKSRATLKVCQIEVAGERVDTAPKVFKSIHIKYHLEGQGLTARMTDRALSLAAEKYCSIAAMLRPKVSISYEHDVKD